MNIRSETVDVAMILAQLDRGALVSCSLAGHRSLLATAGGVIRALVLENYALRQASPETTEERPWAV